MFLLEIKREKSTNHIPKVTQRLVLLKEKRDYLPIFLFFKVDTIVSTLLCKYGGIEGSRTPVQTIIHYIFYMFILLSLFHSFMGNRQSINKLALGS